MKTSHRIGICALAFVAMGGCAGMQDKQSYNPEQRVDDAAYVAQVERTARNRGVIVRWVNIPQKRAKDLAKQ